MKKPARQDILPWIIVVVSALYLITFPDYGFNVADEGLLADGSYRILQGNRVYEDFNPLYPPGRYYLGAAIFGLLGVKLQALSVGMAFFSALLPAMTYQISKHLMPKPFALIAAAMMLAAPSWFTDRFSPFFILLNVLALSAYISRRSNRSIIVAGVSLGMTAVFALDLATFATVAAACVILANKLYEFAGEEGRRLSRFLRNVIREVSFYVLGALIVLVPALATLLPRPGFHQAVARVQKGVLQYAGGSMVLPFPPALPDLVGGQWKHLGIGILLYKSTVFYLLPIAVYGLIAGLLLYRIARKRFSQDDLRLTLLLAIGVISFNTVLFRADHTHLLRCAPPAYVLGCYILCLLYRSGSGWLDRHKRFRAGNLVGRYVALPLVVLIVPISFIGDVIVQHSYPSGSIGVLREEHRLIELERARIHVSEDSADEILRIVGYIRHNTRTGDHLFCVPFEPMWNFLTDRSNTVYWTYHTWPGLLDDELERQVIKELEREQTKYILYNDIALDEIEERRFSNYAPIIHRYIMENYTQEVRIGGHMLLRRT